MSKPREHSLTFGGAGEREIQATGRYLRVMSSPTDDVFISLDSSSEIQMGAGQQVHDGDGFKRVRVRTAVAQTVRLITADFPVNDDRANVALDVSATVAGSTAVQAPGVVTIPAGTSAQLAAANADRIELRVALKSDASSHVWLGPLGVADEQGGLLEPGMIDYLATTAAVYAFNPGATDVDVSVMELESP